VQLRTLLAAGPSRRFNVLETTLRLQAEERDYAQLFRTSFLNRCIIFKTVEVGAKRKGPLVDRNDPDLARTLIYLPYDAERPGDGGEALPYTPENFRRVQEVRSQGAEAWVNGLEEDESILALIDELPTLNPFLLREAFRRAGRPIPEAYLTLDAAVTSRLRRRLDGRVRPLVFAAFGTSDQNLAEHLETTLDALLVPERAGNLRELGSALRIEPEAAPDLLSAWTGIAFFEDELDRLKPSVHAFAHWLAYHAEPLEYVPSVRRRALDTALVRLRSTVRERWRENRKILDAYRESYIALVFEDDPAPFVDFLRGARQRYWRLGELFGAFEQSIHALELYHAQYGEGALPSRVMEEFIDFLELAFQVDKNDRTAPDFIH
jgi:hypothetical protein